MIAPFELDWMGGVAEAHFRRRRPLIDEMPWGTLHASDYPAGAVEYARKSWAEGAYQEYCTAAAFAELLRALLEVRAPVDLIGMAGEFIADEMLHTELNARMAMELGGAPPLVVDFDALTPPVTPGLDAFGRANELAIKYCCVGETLSVPILSGTMRAATHPLTRAVLTRIVQDEPAHARLGWLYLEWAHEQLDDAERERLGRVVADTIARYAPLWSEPATATGAHGGALGWMPPADYDAVARRAVAEDIVGPLARLGISVPGATMTG